MFRYLERSVNFQPKYELGRFKIARIRSFNPRKVKFTSETISEKLAAIFTSFPILADIHPFRTFEIDTVLVC